MDPAMTTPAPMTPQMTPTQIWHRCNDFEEQIQQGLEDGSVRNVMRRIGTPLVSVIFYPCISTTECQYLQMEVLSFVNGTREQQAVYPRASFLFHFLQEWNTPELRQAPIS